MANDLDNTLPERWLDVPGYEGRYQASNLGRIKSLTRHTPTRNRWGPCTYNASERIINGRLDEDGYRRMKLCVAGVTSEQFAHKLIALAFHGECPPECNQVAHWDGDKLNNRPGNLRWATSAENAADRVRHGLTSNQFGERHSHNKLTEEQVLEIRRATRTRSTAADFARKFSIGSQAVRKILRGERWPHIK